MRSAQLRSDVVRAYLAGASAESVAKAFGVAKRSVFNMVKAAGGRPRSPAEAKSIRPPAHPLKARRQRRRPLNAPWTFMEEPGVDARRAVGRSRGPAGGEGMIDDVLAWRAAGGVDTTSPAWRVFASLTPGAEVLVAHQAATEVSGRSAAAPGARLNDGARVAEE